MTDPTDNTPPDRFREMREAYLQRLDALWRDLVEHPERITAPIADSRFADSAWQANPLASFAARAHLINAEAMRALAAAIETEPKFKSRLQFLVSQWADAAAPSNFLAWNPKAQQRAVETGGASLLQGMQNLLADLAKGRISQVDESAFEVGRNVATTEGAVVYENELIQLIQYRPRTARVRGRPLLVVPPCINKYYILDLQPENSLLRYCVEQGNTVFVVSWRNPQAEHGCWTWDDYVEHGPIAAIGAVRDIAKVDTINALGYCIGVTLLATALAVLAARGETPAESLTLLTPLLDFADPGMLDVFIDEAHVAMREATIGKEAGGGLMPGRDLANAFSVLRPNDLVWNYVVNNYLEGRQPPAFDLRYWNADSTNLPGPMFSWYLRNTYLENNLIRPGRVSCCGEPVDLRRIEAPTYVFGAREDHIVPWRAAYAAARTLTGAAERRFALGASGHIAGTINPVSKNRRSYWVAPEPAARRRKAPASSRRAARPLPDPDAWLAAADERPGSWWADWDRWLARFAGEEKAAPRRLGNRRYPPIEPAPGRYVKERDTAHDAGHSDPLSRDGGRGRG